MKKISLFCNGLNHKYNIIQIEHSFWKNPQTGLGWLPLFSRLSEEDIKNQTDKLIDEFARENYHETDFVTAEQYAEYIRSKRADWGEENNYHSGYTMDHFEIEAKKALITPELFSEAKNCEITLEYEPFVSYYKNNFRIAGYYDDTA